MRTNVKLLIFSALSALTIVSFAQQQCDHARLLVWQITTYSNKIYHDDCIVAKRNGLCKVFKWDGTAGRP